MMTKFWAAVVTISVVMLMYLAYDRFTSNYPSLNISCFAYRDIDRNGVYGMDDRPYAGLIIHMERPGGSTAIRTSNISGFANFKMRLGGYRDPVNKPGEYKVQVKPPSGWRVTSDNTQQTLMFKELAAAPAGIVLEKTCVPIGVAPELVISGSLLTDQIDSEAGSFRVRAISPEGDIEEATLSERSGYFLPVAAGDWQLELTVNDETVNRQVSVKNYAVIVSTINPDRNSWPAKPSPVVANFDHFTVSDTLHELPYGYLGLNWINWIATHQKLYGGDGYINTTVSSEYMAYNSSGHLGVVWSETPFDFAGTYLGVAWPRAEEHDVVFKGYRDDQLIYEDRIRAYTVGAIYFDADYRNINRLEIGSDANWQIVLDDAMFRID